MQCVLEFHEAFGLPVAASPGEAAVPAALGELRIDLLVEEVQEFAIAARSGDLVALADALADIVYVTYGAALTYGIDLDAVLREIHRANMSKLGPDGRPVLRADGKVLKPPTYRPPNVGAVLAAQLPLPFDTAV
jgi:predicted HAD superfamily Cof-like phosphohydrolase